MLPENKLFSQSFSNILSNNSTPCISIETLSEKINTMLTQNKKGPAKFGRIKGITEEKGSFLFFKKQ
jgi:hypothetical protein